MGVFVFIFILLMFQALRLTEFVLIHGVDFDQIFQIILYLSVSFLPAIFPMSLLFCILMTYGRLSNDSELVAMKASGLSMFSISLPAFVLGVFVSVLSVYTSFYIGPDGNRKMELVLDRLQKTKASASIKEGVFSEGFFDMVVYTSKVDEETGQLEKIFIYDERNPAAPMVIAAKSGKIIQDKNLESVFAYLKLFDGSIHKQSDEAYTIIDYDEYGIHFFEKDEYIERNKSLPSLTLEDINKRIEAGPPDPTNIDPVSYDRMIRKFNRVRLEFHKRWAIAIACLLFAIIGVGLGVQKNRRSGRSNGFVLSVLVIISFWILYVTGENLVRSGAIYPPLGAWIPLAIFGSFAIYRLRKVWN